MKNKTYKTERFFIIKNRYNESLSLRLHQWGNTEKMQKNKTQNFNKLFSIKIVITKNNSQRSHQWENTRKT